MSHIPKHHPKKEGKSNTSKNGGIHLLISRDAIRVSDLLRDIREGVSIERGWRFVGLDRLESGSRRDHAQHMS